MSKFALFAGLDYYPSGGANDFIKAYDTETEALEAGSMLLLVKHSPDWVNVLNVETGAAWHASRYNGVWSQDEVDRIDWR